MPAGATPCVGHGEKRTPFLRGESIAAPAKRQRAGAASARRSGAGVFGERFGAMPLAERSQESCYKGCIDFMCLWRPHAIPPTQRGASVAHIGGPIDVRTAGAATPQADMTYPPSRSGESVANAADTSLESLGNSGRFREALGKPAGSRPEAYGKPSECAERYEDAKETTMATAESASQLAYAAVVDDLKAEVVELKAEECPRACRGETR